MVGTSIQSKNFQVEQVRNLDTNQSEERSIYERANNKFWNTKDGAFKVLKKYARFCGPGLMVSVAYMDPGNYSTGVTAGASNGYSLLFIVFLSNVIAIFLQSLCIKLGTVTGYDLARCCREYYSRKLNYILWILAECAIIATDVAEVIGSAIALNILFKIPLPAGVVITISDVLFVLIAYRNDTSSVRFVRYFELVVGLLVLAVVICFSIELSKLPATNDTVRKIFRGFVPSKEMVEGSGISIATSIIGATVMIHSLFLGSGLVQPRLREFDLKHGLVKLDNIEEDSDSSSSKNEKTQKEKVAMYFYNDYKPSYRAIRYSLKYSIAETMLMLLTFALFVNSAILIVAGSTLYKTPEAMDADLYTIHRLLSQSIAPAAGTVFMVALLFSGQSAGIVCTIAGQMVSEGHINWTLRPWIRRIVTRSISIVPCLIISLCIGRDGLSVALNISQIVISLLLPPLTAPLIYFTSKKSIMKIEISEEEAKENQSDCVHKDGKNYKLIHNNWITTIFATVIWLFISALNVYTIVDMARNGVS